MVIKVLKTRYNSDIYRNFLEGNVIGRVKLIPICEAFTDEKMKNMFFSVDVLTPKNSRYIVSHFNIQNRITPELIESKELLNLDYAMEYYNKI